MRKAYLKKVNSYSIIVFFQNNNEEDNAFQRGLLIESKDKLDEMTVENETLYDVIIPASQQYLILAPNK